MMNRYEDCSCEDYPCCGHYDSVEAEPYWCDCCGVNHSPFFDCNEDEYEDDEDDEDALALRGPIIAEDAHLEAAYEDRYEYGDY